MNLTDTNSPLSYRSFFLGQDGQLWAWGSNAGNLLLLITDTSEKISQNPTEKGQMCMTPFPMTNFPCSPKDIQQLSVAYNHLLLLTKNGELYGWGSNAQGQLGYTREDPYFLLPRLVKIPGDPKILSVHCADLFSLVITEGGDVFKFQDSWDDPSSVPRKITQLANIVKISTCQHTLALTKEGKVFGWGDGKSGQLGSELRAQVDEPTEILLPEEISEIYTGGRSSMFLTKSGKLYSCGDNDLGQLGIDGTKGKHSPTQVPLEGVVSVACGWDHCLAHTRDGSLYSWGNNNCYQLGIKIPEVEFPFSDSVAWIGSGMDESMVLTKNGNLYTWGANNNLGQGTGNFDAVSRPRIVAGIKFKIPPACIEGLWNNYFWLFLGKGDENSDFFAFPVEIIFNFVTVLLY